MGDQSAKTGFSISIRSMVCQRLASRAEPDKNAALDQTYAVVSSVEFTGTGSLDETKSIDRSALMRVLHIIPSVAARRGGPSQAVLEMVAALRKAGVSAEIATTNDDGPDTLNVSITDLIEYHGSPVRFFKRFSPPVTAVREFAYSYGFTRWLKKHINDYDVIHIHAIFSFCSTYAMWLARQRGVPYIVRPIGQLEDWSLQQSRSRKSLYLRLIEKNNINGASKVHFTAISEQQQALKLLPDAASTVIPLGLNIPMQLRDASHKVREHWKLDRGSPVIVYLSRLHPKKGLDYLLRAFAQLEDQPFQLLIAGDGEQDYQAELADLVNTLGLQDNCKFTGFVKSAEKNLLLQGADLFVLTSHSENFGIAVLEALAGGTAALVSSGVALSQEIKQHQLGYVTEQSVQSITQTLSTALNDIETTQEMGRAARDYVEAHYQWSAIASRLSNLYKQVAD